MTKAELQNKLAAIVDGVDLDAMESEEGLPVLAGFSVIKGLLGALENGHELALMVHVARFAEAQLNQMDAQWN